MPAKNTSSRQGKMQAWKSPSSTPLRSEFPCRDWLIVDSIIQSTHQLLCDLEHFAYPQKGSHCNGSPCLNLLPMPRREAKGHHILLRVPVLLSKPAGPGTQQ